MSKEAFINLSMTKWTFNNNNGIATPLFLSGNWLK